MEVIAILELDMPLMSLSENSSATASQAKTQHRLDGTPASAFLADRLIRGFVMLCRLSGKIALTYGNLARLLGKLQLFRVEVGFALVLGFISGDMLALKVQFLTGDAKLAKLEKDFAVVGFGERLLFLPMQKAARNQ